MTPEELYAIWAPADSIWSQWVIPVPFAQMTCLGSGTEPEEGEPASPNIDSAADLAVVVDLPGGEAIRFGLFLAKRGFRPVPIIDGSPGPSWTLVPAHDRLHAASQKDGVVVVDMTDLLKGLCEGARALQEISMQPLAPPAFLLDSMRMTGEMRTDKEMFDNRWKVFPQDFPSAKFLKERGIRGVLLVQKHAGQAQEDLAHVLLRWQDAGLQVFASAQGQAQDWERINVVRPSRFRATWYRGLEILGLRRSSVGGFGAWPYQTAGG